MDGEVEAIINSNLICIVASRCIQGCENNQSHACLTNFACSITDPRLEEEADKVCERLLGGKGGKGKGIVDNCYPDNELSDEDQSSLLDGNAEKMLEQFAARADSLDSSLSRQLDESLTGKEMC